MASELATAVPVPEFTSVLSNIRRLTASKLAHQAKPAQLLTAIEATLKTALPNEQGPPYSATAYFASLVGCLSKACAPGNKDADDFSDGGLVPAALYLLAAVAPETPRQVVVNQQAALVPLLVGLFDKSLAHPPALRSLIAVVTVVLIATPANGLNGSPLLKRAWNHMLELNLDSRPKVRHLAQEGVRRTLSTPIPPKIVAGDHPYLPRARDWVASVLNEEVKGGTSQAQAKKVKFAGVKGAVMQGSEDMEGKRAIWVIQGLRGWVNVWGEEHLSDLCTLLLALPPLPHLTPQIYSLLALLLSPPPAKDADTPLTIPSQLPNLPVILNALISAPPHSSAPQDQIEYITALSSGMIKLSQQDAYLCSNEFFSKAWTTLWSSILVAPATAPEARRQAVQGLGSQGLIRYCISDDMIARAVEYKIQGGSLDQKRQKMKPPLLTKIISQLEKAMSTQPLLLQYLLPILAALISRLRYRASADAQGVKSKRDSAAYTLVKDLFVEVADLRSQPSFEHKEKVDDVIGVAFEVMGVEAVLESLPLNIEPDASGKPPQPGRAHLLPIMRERITNDSVKYFVNNLVPLSQRLFDRKVKASEGGRAAEAKVWEVVIGQIWDCLPGFLDLARDLREGFTAQFAQLLSQLLYTQPLLRPPILRALSTLVTSMQTLSRSGATSEELLASFGVDQQDAAQSVTYLKGFAGEMLAVLFNVFSSVAREQRGMVGDVIGQWLSIMTEKDVTDTYNKVTGMLATALTSSTKQQDPSLPPVSHTMLDLLIILIPHLPAATAMALFNAASTGNLIENNDAAIQKKCYRILTKLIESEKAAPALQGEAVDHFVNKLADLSANVGVGAQRDRMLLLTALVPKLPKERLHVVLVLVTEAVLGTKEVSEKARNAAYDLLVALGNKMAEGGTISQSLMDGADQPQTNGAKQDDAADAGDDAEMQPVADVNANIEEYIKIVAAGMVGTTPHMISATITALSRLVFEFQDHISRSTMDDLLETIVVFLEAKNREIVKSALGFVKVAVVSLPAEIPRGHLKRLVPALLNWVHDHKNHFKLKTVHIFERMIRKFGYDDVYKCAGEGNEKKVLEHIKKKKDRAKRQKAAKSNGDGDEDEGQARKQTTGSAFEDALYGSASEEESDDDTTAQAKPAAKNAKGARRDKQNAAYLREDEDAPMDLLDRSIAGKITTMDPSGKKRRRPGQDAAAFKVDEDTGRMVIDESESEAEQQQKPSAGDVVAGSAYQTAMTSVDGMRRDDKGRLKFNKNTKRGRALEEENDTDVLQDVMAEEPSKKKKAKKDVEKLGSEFRSKRAGGDVKRAGQADPFSYVPLSKATKQKNPNSRVSLTNKKKGSRRG